MGSQPVARCRAHPPRVRRTGRPGARCRRRAAGASARGEHPPAARRDVGRGRVGDRLLPAPWLRAGRQRALGGVAERLLADPGAPDRDLRRARVAAARRAAAPRGLAKSRRAVTGFPPDPPASRGPGRLPAGPHTRPAAAPGRAGQTRRRRRRSGGALRQRRLPLAELASRQRPTSSSTASSPAAAGGGARARAPAAPPPGTPGARAMRAASSPIRIASSRIGSHDEQCASSASYSVPSVGSVISRRSRATSPRCGRSRAPCPSPCASRSGSPIEVLERAPWLRRRTATPRSPRGWTTRRPR